MAESFIATRKRDYGIFKTVNSLYILKMPMNIFYIEYFKKDILQKNFRTLNYISVISYSGGAYERKNAKNEKTQIANKGTSEEV